MNPFKYFHKSFNATYKNITFFNYWALAVAVAWESQSSSPLAERRMLLRMRGVLDPAVLRRGAAHRVWFSLTAGFESR